MTLNHINRPVDQSKFYWTRTFDKTYWVIGRQLIFMGKNTGLSINAFYVLHCSSMLAKLELLNLK